MVAGSRQLLITARPLVGWNGPEPVRIYPLGAIELEALQEKILTSDEPELTRPKEEVNQVQEELAQRQVELVSPEDR